MPVSLVSLYSGYACVSANMLPHLICNTQPIIYILPFTLTLSFCVRLLVILFYCYIT